MTASTTTSTPSPGPTASPVAAPPEELPTTFALTWDYRCPFARNAHEHVVTALEGGAPFDVRFVPFSLGEMHVEEGEVSVFDNPDKRVDHLAIEAGIVVRDKRPADFLRVHRALFGLRHDDAGDLKDEEQLREALSRKGVDPDFVFHEIESGWPAATFRKEHEAAVSEHSVWGVPTFVIGSQSVFVRLMTRPEGDAGLAQRTIERVLRLFVDLPELNEFKHTSIPR